MPRQVYLFSLLAIIVVGAGCVGQSLLAPDVPPDSAPAEQATISGWVYERVDWADPPVPDALIEVRAADGTTTTAVSDLRGFYAVSVRPGDVSITTSKAGHEVQTTRLRLLADTVLNFYLAPE